MWSKELKNFEKGFLLNNLPVQMWIVSLQIIWTGEVINVLILTSGANQSQTHQYQAESIRYQKTSVITIKKMKIKSFFTSKCVLSILWFFTRFSSSEISTCILRVTKQLCPTHILFILPGSQQHTEACG